MERRQILVPSYLLAANCKFRENICVVLRYNEISCVNVPVLFQRHRSVIRSMSATITRLDPYLKCVQRSPYLFELALLFIQHKSKTDTRVHCVQSAVAICYYRLCSGRVKKAAEILPMSYECETMIFFSKLKGEFGSDRFKHSKRKPMLFRQAKISNLG